MNWYRIFALMYRYGLLLRHDLGKILDMFYWPIIDLFAWGLLVLHINKSQLFQANFATPLLSAIILWTLVYTLGRDVAISFLDDVWDRNILNLYGSPLKPIEFLIASFLIALLRVTISVTTLAVLAYILYGFSILSLGVYLGLFFLILVIFSYTIGIFAITIIMRFGPGFEIIAWSIPAVLSPFSAVFYPLSILPSVVQMIALLFPSTYVFEGMRTALLQRSQNWQLLGIACILDVIYLITAFLIFHKTFDYAKRTGLITRFA